MRILQRPGDKDPQLVPHIYASDPKMCSADGFAIGGGYLYIADSRLWEVAFKNNHVRSGPFSILRVKLPVRPFTP